MTVPSVSDILDSLPLPDIVPVTPRPSYIILGKPGCGRSTLAAKLASSLNARLISPEGVLKNATISTTDADADNTTSKNEITRLLAQGKEIHTDALLKMMEDDMKNDETVYRGYVLEGLPYPLSSSPDTDSMDLNYLTSLIKSSPSHHIPVLINLNITDDDLVRRRAAQWVDMETGIVYPGAQVVWSRKKRVEKGTDDEEGSEAEGSEKDSEEEDDDDSEKGDEEDDEEDEEGSEDGEKKAKKTKGKGEENIGLVNKVEWPLIPMEVLERLVKRPEDSPDYTTTLLHTYNTHYTSRLTTLTSTFPSHRIVNIDASQHPDVIFRDLMNRLDALGYGIFGKAVLAKPLSPPEGGFKPGTKEDEMVRYYSTTDLAPHEPKRELGMWGKYCAVSYKETATLCQVPTYDYAVAYRGKIYFLGMPLHQRMFIANPLAYLSTRPRLSPLRISVLGGPVSGKTTQAKLLASIYGLVYISLDEVFEEWGALSVEEGVAKWGSVFEKIVRKCRLGKTMPAEMVVEVVKGVVKRVGESGQIFNGWVLDGFPKTVDQANALISADLIPQYAVVLQNDINDDTVRSRHQIFTVDPRTSKPPSTINTHTILAYPHFDNLFNGFREEFSDIVKILEDKDTAFVNVQAELGIHTVLSSVMSVVDPFLPKAVALTPKMQSELPSTVPLGYTKDYCPYVLKESAVLMKGDRNYSVKYQGLYYHLSTDEAKITFATEPQNYVASRNPMIPPPPRLIMLGVPGSGKQTLINQLLTEYAHTGITHVTWEEYLLEYKDRQEKELREEIEYAIKENAGVLGTVVLVDILKSLFFGEPYSRTGLILTHFPHTKLDLETLLKHNLHPDAFIYLSTDADVASRRIVKRMLKEGKRSKKALEREESGEKDEEVDKEEELGEEVLEETEKEVSNISEITSTIEALSSIPVLEIDANRNIRPIYAALKEKLKPYLDYRQSLFCNGYAISRKEAEKLLDLGVKSWSVFGKYCPVTLTKNRYLTNKTLGTYPVVYKDHIYFLRDKASRDVFLHNTLTYTTQPPPPPIVHPTLFITGPPKSGKTTLATALSKDLDVIYLDIPGVLRSVLEGEEVVGGIYEQLKATLEGGNAVPDDLVTEAIRIVTSRAICQEKGWVLDGYPYTKEQTLQLEKSGVLPHMILHLELDYKTVMARCAEDFATSQQAHTPTPSIPPLIQTHHTLYKTNIEDIKKMYETTYGNWTDMDARKSKWALKSLVGRVVRGNVERRQGHLGAVATGNAARVEDIGISLSYIESHMGKYGDYCPVSFVDHNELVKGAEGTQYMAEYQGLYYRLSSPTTLQTFLSNPTKYTTGPALPAHLPLKRTKNDLRKLFPKTLELQGYCPVTFAEGKGKGFENIVPGNHDLVVEYEEKLFAMFDQETLERFMRTPWKYSNLRLPHKLPPRQAPIPVGTLPLIGYLEQTVATTITEGLLAVGKARPKYPFKGLDESAVDYLGLWLKANNPNAKDWTRKAYAKRLMQYQNRCELVGFLGGGAGGSGFLEPERRVEGFDKRMGEFLSLRPVKGVR